MKLTKSAIIEELSSRKNLFLTHKTEKSEIVSLLETLYPRTGSQKLIRFGPDGDGGYLVPDDLQNIGACFSPGVSSISGFEKECAERGIKVFLADKSVESPADEHELFDFIPKFIGATSDDDFMTLDEWVRNSMPDSRSDLILQMDIEGYEYEVLLSSSEELMNRFRILVIEFHSLEQFWNRPFFNIVRRAFDKISQTHTCVHIHPNNCCGSTEKEDLELPRLMEFTFLRNDRLGDSSYQTKYPHALDFDNTAEPTIVLPDCWHKRS